MLSRAFLDDPLKIVIQPQSQHLAPLLFDLTRYLFSVSSYRGLCVATVSCDNKGRQVLQMARSEVAEQYPNQVDYDSFSACMIGNPPGQESGYWGNTANLVKIYTSAGISTKTLVVFQREKKCTASTAAVLRTTSTSVGLQHLSHSKATGLVATSWTGHVR